MSVRQSESEKQMAQAEQLLGERLHAAGFAKALYFGWYAHDALAAYPDVERDQRVSNLADSLRRYCAESIDPVQIDRQAEIPPQVIAGLGKLGVLGACLPKSCGGLELSQTAYCRLLETLGGHCGSTALFVNAHHSIGPRALVLFGNQEQQARWLPKLASGEWLSAFALTEPEAGSDAANVQTTATLTPDGRGYVLNGEKRWITNGGIAQVLTVMARTAPKDAEDGRITAFVVTPDMPGFEVVEARMPKCGVRGTATSRLAFHDMFVPRENVLGAPGKGLKVALTVLDFGRTTFGASCTGAARFCLQRATGHAQTRVQFGRPLAEFELVREKLAAMSAGVLAMEAATNQTAALIDAARSEYMIETAMLKVFATETLWTIVNDTIQIFGGKAYFTDEPYERMMRDARINMIGEGANDVLRAFIALVGMRDVGLQLQGLLAALQRPLANLGRLGSFAGRRLESLFASPEVPVVHAQLQPYAARLGKLVGTFGAQVEKLLRTHREAILERQCLLARVADAATELYVSACVLRRLDRRLEHDNGSTPHECDLAVSRYYLQSAERRIRANLQSLWSNDDAAMTTAAEFLTRR